MVKPDKIDDLTAVRLSREIASKIEKNWITLDILG